METFEKMILKVVRYPKFGRKVLLGIIVSLIPIVNFLALLYLEIFGKQKEEELPCWCLICKGIKTDWKKTLRSTLFATLLFAAIVVVPTALCTVALNFINRGLLGSCIGLFLSAPAFAYATTSQEKSKSFRGILDETKKAYKLSFDSCLSWLVPAFIFAGLQIVSFISLTAFFLPATMFLGYIFLIPYAKGMRANDENTKKRKSVNRK